MLQIVLVPFRGAVHLPEESGVLRVAARVVGAAQSHGGFELEGGGAGCGDQMLFLLQYGEQHFGTDAAGFGGFADDSCRGFAFRALIGFAFAAGGFVFAVEGHDAQALAPGAGGSLLVEERLDFRLAHGVAVEELPVGDDVAWVESVSLCGLVLPVFGDGDFRPPLDDAYESHDECHGANYRHDGFRRDKTTFAEARMLPGCAVLRLPVADPLFPCRVAPDDWSSCRGACSCRCC